MSPDRFSQLFDRVKGIIESARATAARSVNTAQVVANWLIGREIVEEEQGGRTRAEYGRRLIADLSEKLTREFGRGYTTRNLADFRSFYVQYPGLLILRAPRAKSWEPGQLNKNLSWSHYRALLRLEKGEVRSFYEVEAARNCWAGRELERQISSLLYERLAKSRDKEGLLRLARKGQEVQRPADVFKDPLVIEFLGARGSPGLAESDLEGALTDNLQRFLLELGRGFAFVSRQERITVEGDHFYIDLVFYHAILKCYVLIDLKTVKLTHQDLGQMQFYVHYFDQERRTKGDGPTLGLILCTDKNDAVVRYTLGKGQKNIFASRYQLHLPTEAELGAEMRRKMLEQVLRCRSCMSA